MAILQSTNVVGSLCVNGVAVGGGKDYHYQCYSGSTTFTPTSDLVSGNGILRAHVVGAGGGGGGSWGWGLSQTTYQCPVRTSSGNVSAGSHGASGNYQEKDVFITSTNNCTVTVGAAGAGGVATGNATCTSITTVCDSLAVTTQATTGGNSSFGGFTAYGGCGGQTRAMAARAYGCQANQAFCAESGPAVTDGGTGGAYTTYRMQMQNPGVCLSQVVPGPVTGSDNAAYEAIMTCKGTGDGGVGVEGVSLERRCGVYPGCNVDANMEVSCGQNGVKTSFTFGNAGVRGSQTFCGNNPGTPLVYFGSGSAGTGGIVVLQWME